MLYRHLVRPWVGPPAQLEPEAAPRFAQAVGLVFAVIGVAGFAAALTWLGMVATAAALAAAFLNSVFGFCLGCEMYVLIRRIWAGRRALVPANADKEASSMGRADVLVDADWVQAHLDDPCVVPVEVDEDTAYDNGHIHGAVRLDWKQELQDPVTRGFLGRADFEALLSRRGISNDDMVILYGGNNNWFAAYAYWYFKVYGHRSVRLLEGGRTKWELDSREMVAQVPQRPPTVYRAQKQERWIRMLISARSRDICLPRRRRWPWERGSKRSAATGLEPSQPPLLVEPRELTEAGDRLDRIPDAPSRPAKHRQMRAHSVTGRQVMPVTSEDVS